jgi:hypothetical protein
MTPAVAPDAALWAEIAALLARGYLRLASDGESVAMVGPDSRENPLESWHGESPHGTENSSRRRGRWTKP